MKTYIENYQYFELLRLLTVQTSLIWGNNTNYLRILQKLMKAFMQAEKKINNLRFEWECEINMQKRDKVLKKYNQAKKGFYVPFIKEEIEFLKTYIDYLKELRFMDIKPEATAFLTE